MPDFTWTQQHDLLRPRAAIQAAFEQLGFRFTAGQPASRRPERPRVIGETTDQPARIELIGPAEAVFKATLMRTSPGSPPAALAPIQRDLVDFLTVMTPAWEGGAQWVIDHWDLLSTNQGVETQFRDVVIALRTARSGRQIVLGITWQPRHDRSMGQAIGS